MIDLLYLTHDRLEFTKASVTALLANTDFRRVRRVYLYDDNSTDGTRDYLLAVKFPVDCVYYCFGEFGGPVGCMNDYLSSLDPLDETVFAKVDNDVMLPPGWLGECLPLFE